MKKHVCKLLAMLLLCTLVLSGCANDGGPIEETTQPSVSENPESGSKEGETTLPPMVGESADVRFIVDNELYAQFSKNGIPSKPTKQGYRFDGWYLDKGTWEQPVDMSTWSGKSVSEVLALLAHTADTDCSLWAKFVEVPPEGYLPGNLCYNYTVPLFEGEGAANFKLARAGKVTVINFWGTWCGPCKSELPHFDELAREYGDEIVMVAIHSNQGISNAPAYIAEHYADSPILFGFDNASSDCYLLLGGIGYYPMTLVLDENGIVVDTRIGALSKDELRAIIETALGN